MESEETTAAEQQVDRCDCWKGAVLMAMAAFALGFAIAIAVAVSYQPFQSMPKAVPVTARIDMAGALIGLRLVGEDGGQQSPGPIETRLMQRLAECGATVYRLEDLPAEPIKPRDVRASYHYVVTGSVSQDQVAIRFNHEEGWVISAFAGHANDPMTAADQAVMDFLRTRTDDPPPSSSPLL